MNEHGDLWEPSEAGSASPPRKGASRLDRRSWLLNWPRMLARAFWGTPARYGKMDDRFR